jgi:hypothetical protein
MRARLCPLQNAAKSPTNGLLSTFSHSASAKMSECLRLKDLPVDSLDA